MGEGRRVLIFFVCLFSYLNYFQLKISCVKSHICFNSTIKLPHRLHKLINYWRGLKCCILLCLSIRDIGFIGITISFAKAGNNHFDHLT